MMIYVGCAAILLLLFLFATRVLVGIEAAKKRTADEGSGNAEKKTYKRSAFKSFLENGYKGFVRSFLFVLSYFPSHCVRLFLLRHVFLARISPKAVIYYGFEIRAPYKLHIGRGSIIGDKSILDARNGLWIGDNVNLSTGVWIWTSQHDYDDPHFGLDEKKNGVRIGNRAWLGSRVTILPDVDIGEGAVVAAGSVVTKSVDPYVIVGGVPAKKIGERNRDLQYDFDGSHPFFI
jgi:acetyltransferase-like isoleucine patch superfamily enzyme